MGSIGFIRSRWRIAVLLLGHILVGAVYAVVTPLFEASDELWHYPMVQTLWAGNGLPVQDMNSQGPWRQEASQPPLYYYLMAWATRGIDQSDMDEVRWLNPHADHGIVTPDGNINMVVHTDRDRWPWYGTALAVRVIRLLSALLNAVGVYCAYRLMLELAPRREDLALAAAAFVAFRPMAAFIGASVNNDNLAVPVSSATLLALVHLARAQGWGAFERFGRWAGAAACGTLGVLLGIGALGKISTLGLAGLAGLTLTYLAILRWRNRPSSGTTDQTHHSLLRHLLWLVGYGTLTIGIAAAISGWWYLRNLQLYGDLLGWEMFVIVSGVRGVPASIAQQWSERSGFMQSFWGLFGGVNVPMHDAVYVVLNAFGIAAAAGVLVFIARKFRNDRLSVATWVPLGIAAAWAALVVVGLVRWSTYTWSSQGRLVFSGIASIAVLWVFGLSAWIPKRWHPPAFAAHNLLLFGLTLAAPFLWLAPAYAPAPFLDDVEQAAIPNRIDADFGGEMTLLGYSVSPQTIRPGEAVEVVLYWRGEIAMDRDWSVFIHLQDENQILFAQRDTFPGVGRLATRRLAPGQAFADRYVIRVPDTVPNTARLDLVVGLYDKRDGFRLGTASGDSLALASLYLLPNDGDVPNPVSLNFGNEVVLAGYEVNRRAVLPGESIELTLYWRAFQPITLNYSVFAHVRGEGHTLWAGSDAWPQDGAAPTSLWEAGEVVKDSHTLTLHPDTPPGVYEVEVGVYNAEDGERLALFIPGKLAENHVNLFRVRVLAP